MKIQVLENQFAFSCIMQNCRIDDVRVLRDSTKTEHWRDIYPHSFYLYLSLRIYTSIEMGFHYRIEDRDTPRSYPNEFVSADTPSIGKQKNSLV